MTTKNDKNGNSNSRFLPIRSDSKLKMQHLNNGNTFNHLKNNNNDSYFNLNTIENKVDDSIANLPNGNTNEIKFLTPFLFSKENSLNDREPGVERKVVTPSREECPICQMLWPTGTNFYECQNAAAKRLDNLLMHNSVCLFAFLCFIFYYFYFAFAFAFITLTINCFVFTVSFA